MRRAPLLLLLFSFLAFSGASIAADNAPLTLQEAYQLSLKRSEDIALNAEEIELAQSRFYRALGYFLPSVDFQVTRRYQDASGGGEGILADSRRRKTPEQKFTFSQPIFSGFKEFAAIRASGADRKQRELLLRRAQELLFVDVTDAFYTALETRRTVHILENLNADLLRRMEELKGRVKLGRSRRTEIQTAYADLKLNESDLVLASYEAGIAEELLEFYVGRPVAGTLIAAGALPADEPLETGSRQKALERSDVRAAEEASALADQELFGEKADLIPHVSLDGNYYTERVGSQSENEWDVTFKLSLPVFDAGETLADIKEAAAHREQAHLMERQAHRVAELDIRNAARAFRASVQADKALRQAQKAAKDNFETLVEEYRLSLVNNLDVLDALQRYRGVQRRANAGRYAARKDFWKLKAALGEVPGSKGVR